MSNSDTTAPVETDAPAYDLRIDWATTDAAEADVLVVRLIGGSADHRWKRCLGDAASGALSGFWQDQDHETPVPFGWMAVQDDGRLLIQDVDAIGNEASWFRHVVERTVQTANRRATAEVAANANGVALARLADWLRKDAARLADWHRTAAA